MPSGVAHHPALWPFSDKQRQEYVKTSEEGK